MNFEKNAINSAKMLLLFMTGVFGVTGLFFLMGISINYFNFILPFGIMLYVRYSFFPEKKEGYFLDVAICIIVIGVVVLMAANVYDNTWDGSAYHKQAVGLLKEGWNPVYMLSNDFNNATLSVRYAKDGPLLWAESYPKATWYFAAVIYYITGNIEAGKCYTLLFAYITFGMCLDFFRKKLHGNRAGLLALFAALNPIVCAQFQSYYLDGVVACVLCMLIITFVAIINNEENEISKVQYIEIFCLIIWGCNLKFSVVVFVVTLCGLFCIFNSYKRKKLDIKNTGILFIDGVISVFVCGFAPYITNVIRHGSMFYGLEGLMNEDDMQAQFGVEGLNRTGRFLTSLFGKMSHGEHKTLGEVLKIPFTFSKEELYYYNFVDVRVGGFGIFFSGLLVIAILIIITEFVKRRKMRSVSLSFSFVISLICVSMFEFCVIPQTSQFRYVPHLYLCVIFALYLLLREWNKSSFYKFVNISCCILIIFNMLPWGYSALRRINQGTYTTATLQGMESECAEMGSVYEIGFYSDDFTGIHYNLKDFNVDYVYKNIGEMGTEYKLTYSNWLYYKVSPK